MFRELFVTFQTRFASARFAPSLMIAMSLAASSSWPRSAMATEPVRQGQESFLVRAVFADGYLWLLSDAGQLSAIAEKGNKRVDADLSEPVLDLCRNEGHALVVTGAPGKDWTLRQRIRKNWSRLTVVPRNGDELRALHCAGGTETIFTSNRLIRIDQHGAIQANVLSQMLNHGTITAVQDSGNDFYVGFNAGEWGGGLQRIDKSTGAVAFVERNTSGGLCSGPLNSDCDAVNGIAREPWNANCLTVAVGLVHMEAHGSIVEVCGDKIRSLYAKPYGPTVRNERGSFTASEPFFGLEASGNALWAVGIDGLYRIDRNGNATSTTLPEFKTIDGIKVSFAQSEFIFVVTDVNQRHSISGSVPMLVPR
jgi:hypothetical protein